jgi:formylglycine-generating enzyme required for sulfatase activity
MGIAVRILALGALMLPVACFSGIEPPLPTALVSVEGGVFLFGSTEPCFNADQNEVTCASNAYGMPQTFPTVSVSLPAFWIEEHEVTNLQYRYCVEMGGCRFPEFTNTTGIEDYFGNSAHDNFPVVNVTAEMAEEYCTFVGRRLPTEAEWERAASGKATTLAQKRFWPVQDNSIDIRRCNSGALAINLYHCNTRNTPVAVKASAQDFVEEGGARIWDMAGNVSEFVAGFYDLDVACKDELPESCDCFRCGSADNACKESCYTECSECTNNPDCYGQCESEFPPRGLPRCIMYAAGDAQIPATIFRTTGTERMLRGGNYQVRANQTCRARATDRFFHLGTSQFGPAYGFRCAADSGL